MGGRLSAAGQRLPIADIQHGSFTRPHPAPRPLPSESPRADSARHSQSVATADHRGSFRRQLHRILQRAFRKPPYSCGKTHRVRVPYPPLDRIAPPRTRPQTPAKQGFSYARADRLAAPCEALRQAAAPNSAPLLQSDLRSPADSASKRPSRCSRSWTRRPSVAT